MLRVLLLLTGKILRGKKQFKTDSMENKLGWGEHHKMKNKSFAETNENNNAGGHHTGGHQHFAADGKNNQGHAQTNPKQGCKRNLDLYNNLMSSWNSLANKSASNPEAVSIRNQIVLVVSYININGCGSLSIPSFSAPSIPFTGGYSADGSHPHHGHHHHHHHGDTMHFTGIDSAPAQMNNAQYSWADSIFTSPIQNNSAFSTGMMSMNTSGCNCGSNTTNCNCNDTANTLPAANTPSTTTAPTVMGKKKSFIQWLLDGMK